MRAFAISWRLRARNACTNSGSNALRSASSASKAASDSSSVRGSEHEVVEAVGVRPAAAAAARCAARCRRASRRACRARARYGFDAARAEAILDVRRVAAPGLDADRDRAVLEAPGDARRRVGALAVALGAVDGRAEEGVQRGARAPAARRSPSGTPASARPASASQKTLRAPSKRLMCRWLLEPLASMNGFVMKLATQAVLRRDLLRVRLVREVVVAAGEALARARTSARTASGPTPG